MKTIKLSVCAIGLAVVMGDATASRSAMHAASQAKSGPPVVARWSFDSRDVEVSPDGRRLSAHGAVEIRVDSILMTADEADIRFGAPGEPSDIELRGRVRVRAVLR